MTMLTRRSHLRLLHSPTISFTKSSTLFASVRCAPGWPEHTFVRRPLNRVIPDFPIAICAAMEQTPSFPRVSRSLLRADLSRSDVRVKAARLRIERIGTKKTGSLMAEGRSSRELSFRRLFLLACLTENTTFFTKNIQILRKSRRRIEANITKSNMFGRQDRCVCRHDETRLARSFMYDLSRT